MENYCHHHNTLFTVTIVTQLSYINTISLPIEIHLQIARCHLVETEYGRWCSFLYWFPLTTLKVQLLTLSEWQIVIVFKLEGSQHTQRINRHLAHLPNSLCFVLMASIVGHHLSSDGLLEWWQRQAHCSYRVHHLCYCDLPEEHVFPSWMISVLPWKTLLMV